MGPETETVIPALEFLWRADVNFNPSEQRTLKHRVLSVLEFTACFFFYPQIVVSECISGYMCQQTL